MCDYCTPLKLLVVWGSFITTPSCLHFSTSEYAFLMTDKCRKVDFQVIQVLKCMTWTKIAAFVIFLNLNSLRAAIALKPVCKTRTEKWSLRYLFQAWYLRVFFWIFIAAASLLIWSKILQASLPAIYTKTHKNINSKQKLTEQSTHALKTCARQRRENITKSFCSGD